MKVCHVKLVVYLCMITISALVPRTVHAFFLLIFYNFKDVCFVFTFSCIKHYIVKLYFKVLLSKISNKIPTRK